MVPTVLPLLIADPVRPGPDRLDLGLPGLPPVPLGGSHHPVRAFNRGWRAHELFTLLDPLLLLVLRHEDGTFAAWFVERDGTLSPPPEQRTEADRADYASRLAGILFWLRDAPDAPIRAPVPPDVEAFLALPPAVREALDPAFGAPGAGPAPSALASRDETRAAGAAVDRPELVATTVRHGDDPAPDADSDPPPAPDAADDPSHPRHVLFGNPGRLVMLRGGGGEPAVLGPGWRIDAVEPAGSPVLCLPLSHADGSRAVWFTDLSGRMLSHATGLLPVELGRHLFRRAEPLVRDLWQRTVCGARAGRPAALTQGLGRLPPSDLAALHRFAPGGAPTVSWSIGDRPPPGTAYVVPTLRGLHPLDPVHVRRALAHGLQNEMDRLLAENRMCWPSPFDGTIVSSDGFALLLGPGCFAYRFRQEALGAAFLVVCTGIHFREHAIWFPDADLLVAADAGTLSECRPWFGMARPHLTHHVLLHAASLAVGTLQPVDREVRLFFGSNAVHIGHYVWQDLSGLAFLLRGAVRHGRLPRLQMFDTAWTHSFFGPEEGLFPVLAGRVERHPDGFDRAVPAFYAANRRLVRYTAITVPAELGPAVLRAADAALPDEAAAADALRAAAVSAAAPVVLLGLRFGTRAMADQEEFLCALLRRLAAEFPGCAVILDGMNDPGDRGTARPEDLVPAEPPGFHDPSVSAQTRADADAERARVGAIVAAEARLAAVLAAVAEENGLGFRSNINRSARISVLWCRRADAFLAPWGAAL
ncbi:MAG: hypothetical protein INR65_12095, partial [Gluconacetobacter diazotrophicus]|nr:hypothetical protein [Gluconacetobacter diazotrophicus]